MEIKPISLELSENLKKAIDIQKYCNDLYLSYIFRIPKERFDKHPKKNPREINL